MNMNPNGWNENDDDHTEHEDHGDDGDGNNFGSWNFSIPLDFKIDLADLNLKQLGKITDYDITHKHVSVTLGHDWTFSVDGSGLDFTMKGNSHMPVVTGGTVDSFTIDGPGKADFEISGLDMSAKAFYDAITHFDAAKVLSLVLGGNETLSGSGYGDLLYAGAGNDTVLGNGGNDWLQGGAGNDVINGGTGNDLLQGDAGSDVFVFSAASGHDIINDFNGYTDVIDLTALHLNKSFDAFMHDNVISMGDHEIEHGDDGRCVVRDGGVIIDLGHGNAIKVENIGSWDLNESNVLL
jgi:Ca2+-binding RTX toxin-like protein